LSSIANLFTSFIKIVIIVIILKESGNNNRITWRLRGDFFAEYPE